MYCSKFGDIFDEEFFIYALRNNVNVIRELPGDVLQRFDNNISNIVNLRLKAWSSPTYYIQKVLPKLLQKGLLNQNLADNKPIPHIPKREPSPNTQNEIFKLQVIGKTVWLICGRTWMHAQHSSHRRAWDVRKRLGRVHEKISGTDQRRGLNKLDAGLIPVVEALESPLMELLIPSRCFICKEPTELVVQQVLLWLVFNLDWTWGFRAELPPALFWAVRVAPFSNRLAHAVPSDSQSLRCLANFEALRFSDPIRMLAENMVDRMIKNSSESGGKYISVHLRFEEVAESVSLLLQGTDMVAFSCCMYDGGEEEKHEMDIARERGWRGKFNKRGRIIRPGAIRMDGKCPLTPLEVLHRTLVTTFSSFISNLRHIASQIPCAIELNIASSL
ncbi:O-fucosyltransferase 9 [Vitis vinifera]|uniref:O-fucosyltransferase family protein n=1 Tax=Vitis vinifera TaxID=29760 RepID=A0A438IX26_VITVI|nr:O-fucosyltransferase 9 [Vitis vinifera]